MQLDNAFVPDTHVIGEVDRGWNHMLTTLNNERILVAALCTGVLRGVLEEAIDYAKERRAFGKPIGEFQVIQHWIADMEMKLAQAELLTYKAAWLYDNGPAVPQSSRRWRRRSPLSTPPGRPTAGSRSSAAMGYSAEFEMQRYWRDARLYQIGPMTNEMVRNIVAQSVGLNRSY